MFSSLTLSRDESCSSVPLVRNTCLEPHTWVSRTANHPSDRFDTERATWRTGGWGEVNLELSLLRPVIVHSVMLGLD